MIDGSFGERLWFKYMDFWDDESWMYDDSTYLSLKVLKHQRPDEGKVMNLKRRGFQCSEEQTNLQILFPTDPHLWHVVCAVHTGFGFLSRASRGS
jgi:hypothetical protein